MCRNNLDNFLLKFFVNESMISFLACVGAVEYRKEVRPHPAPLSSLQWTGEVRTALHLPHTHGNWNVRNHVF